MITVSITLSLFLSFPVGGWGWSPPQSVPGSSRGVALFVCKPRTKTFLITTVYLPGTHLE